MQKLGNKQIGPTEVSSVEEDELFGDSYTHNVSAPHFERECYLRLAYERESEVAEARKLGDHRREFDANGSRETQLLEP